MNQLQQATYEDYMRAVNIDGTPVDAIRAMAAEIFACTYESVTPSQRRTSKSKMYRAMYANTFTKWRFKNAANGTQKA